MADLPPYAGFHRDGPTGLHVYRLLSRKGLPGAERGIDLSWIELIPGRPGAGLLGGDEGGAEHGGFSEELKGCQGLALMSKRSLFAPIDPINPIKCAYLLHQ